jgi:hypothetical protein
MCRWMLLAFSFLCFGSMATAEEGAAAALAKLRDLAGDWEGSFQWTGARSASGKMNASYYVTGGGSAVIENLIVDGAPIMTSAYHLDGTDLRVTHYCAAQNQPRLSASRIDIAQGILDFAFVDITNLRSPDSPHVVGLELRLLTADHVIVTFLFEGAGKRSRERIELKRLPKKNMSWFSVPNNTRGGRGWFSPGVRECHRAISS